MSGGRRRNRREGRDAHPTVAEFVPAAATIQLAGEAVLARREIADTVPTARAGALTEAALLTVAAAAVGGAGTTVFTSRGVAASITTTGHAPPGAALLTERAPAIPRASAAGLAPFGVAASITAARRGHAAAEAALAAERTAAVDAAGPAVLAP